jgi:hypothetical protein
MRHLSFGTICAFVVIAWGANLHVVHGVDVVFINVAPANDNRRVRGLREFNLNDESLHDRQRFSQGTGVEFRDQTPHGHDVDVGEILRKIRK